MSAQGTVVRDAAERSRYEPHVEVESALRGGTLGSVLVRQMLDDVRNRGLSIRPLCPFVRVYIRGHQEYADLVAAS
jgi:uncharacterized protein